MNTSPNTLRQISSQDFMAFGVNDLAYIKVVDVDGSTGYAIHAADGTPLGSETLIASGTLNQTDPTIIALSGGGYAVVWTDGWSGMTATTTAPVPAATASRSATRVRPPDSSSTRAASGSKKTSCGAPHGPARAHPHPVATPRARDERERRDQRAGRPPAEWQRGLRRRRSPSVHERPEGRDPDRRSAERGVAQPSRARALVPHPEL